MEDRTLLDFLARAEKLKCNTRHSWTSSDRHESVAEHSWRISLMAMLLTKEFPEADMDKVIRMCLIHDLGEAFTGDIPTCFLKNVPNEEALGKFSSSAISLMLLSVVVISDIAFFVIALKTSCCTVHPDTDLTSVVRYFGDRHRRSA